LATLLQRNDLNGEMMKVIADKEYTWKAITAQYESLY
jgi:hypothetical protein